LTVDQGAAITSAASHSATVGKAFSVKMTSSGFPTVYHSRRGHAGDGRNPHALQFYRV
jgi:hypothetical protein